MNNETPLLEHDLETLLELGNEIFEKIGKAASEGNFDLAYHIIENMPPPKEWIVEYPSLLDVNKNYQTIHLQLLRKAMQRIFGRFFISGVEKQYITVCSITGKFASTSIITLQYKDLDTKNEYQLNSYGIATDTCDQLELLRLCTPSSISLAEKDAIMRLGDLFGRSLNGRGVGKVQDEKEEKQLRKADAKIIETYKKAVEDNDLEKQAQLLKVYDIKISLDAS